MADGRDSAPGFSFRKTFPWTDLFRCFQVALDPRKLALAALGILAMSVGWWLLSLVFWYNEPLRANPDYGVEATAKEYAGNKPGTNPPAPYSEADLRQLAEDKYQADHRKWVVMDELAGPSGRLRSMPWDEYRGPNPYIFLTRILGGSTFERQASLREFVTGSVPVLVEPLIKFLVPVSKLFAPGDGALTRFYVLLAVLWFLVVWGFAGGVITRLAAIGLANKGPTTLRQAVRFVAARYLNYLLSPMVPLLIIAAVIVGLIVYGFLSLIPILGDIVLLGLGLPVVIAAGAVMSVFLIGLVGYPLMYATLSAEGDSSDTFDALSRSINYVYQAPWHYIWYWLVAVCYGAVVTFFILFFTSLSVYLGKWAVSQTPFNETFNRRPDFLFLYAPPSFGWQELLLKGSPAEVRPVDERNENTGRVVKRYVPENPQRREEFKKEFYFYNWAGAGIGGFWLALIFLLMLGFTYSFYWTAATMIYFLMRSKVDEADMDEVYLEEDEPETPLAPPKAVSPPATSLNVLPPPVATAPVPPPAPATLPFSPPPAPPSSMIDSPPAEEPRLGDGKPPLM